MNSFRQLNRVSGDSDSILEAICGRSFSRISEVIRFRSLGCLASDSVTRNVAYLKSSTCFDFIVSHDSRLVASNSTRTGFASFCLNDEELSISLNANM